MPIFKEDNMNIGIYSRKSIYSDKSDSISSQTKLCQEYIKNNYTYITSITEYEDEGFTGANTNRPGFTQLLKDIKANKINIIICYRIDRISRNVLDFSQTFNILQEYGVEFVSLKEQIDTSTPLGRAMMYICSVFAQMERETIAERVKDNMIELAKSGKWAGGQAPIGYKREKILIAGKTHTTLVENPDEIPFLQMIYDKFLEGYTLSGLETYFRKNNILTLNNKYMSAAQIHAILKNPQCVAATPGIYDYFSNKGCIMATEKEKYDGQHSLIVYGRTNGGKKKTHSNNPPEKWLVALGLHKPLISAEKWIAVQERFGKNKIDKTRKHNVGLLKGIMKCKCGYTIRVQHKVDKTYNKIYDNYFCQNRNRRGAKYCDMKMVNVYDVDNLLLDVLKKISLDKNFLNNYMQSDAVSNNFRSKEIVLCDIKSIERKISNLTANLQEHINSAAAKYIISDIEKFDNQIVGLNYELREISLQENECNNKKANIDEVYSKICSYLDRFDNLDYFDKTSFLQEIIKECIWDGNNLFLTF
jgi:DNA invertase Pin-like site-specific DNA recombinase